MRGVLILAGLMVASAGSRAAEAEIEPLDGAFLEYLANLEGDDDNWTLLAEADEKPPARADKPQSETAKPAQPGKETAQPRKTSKDAEAPAAEDR